MEVSLQNSQKHSLSKLSIEKEIGISSLLASQASDFSPPKNNDYIPPNPQQPLLSFDEVLEGKLKFSDESEENVNQEETIQEKNIENNKEIVPIKPISSTYSV